MSKKFLFPLLLCLILALPAHATITPAPDPVPGKGKISSPQATKDRVIVIRTAKDPKVNQVKIGEKGEILIPQSTAIAGAAIAGAAAGGAASGGAANPGPGAANAGALKEAETGDDANSGDSKKKEDTGIKGASGTSGSGDSKPSGLSSGSTGNDSGLLGGGVPSGFGTVPDTTALIPDTTAATPFLTSTTSSTSTTTTPSLPTAELQALLDLTVSDAGIPGAIMAVQTSAGTWIGAAGKADLGDVTGTPQDMTADTQVRLAGVTRLFTAALIMKLVEENKIKLDDKVDDLLGPFAVPSGDQITVAMLLNHTSGLHDHETTQEFFNSLLFSQLLPWGPFVDILPIMELYLGDFNPGTDFKSSSSDYYLLGMMAGAVAGNLDAPDPLQDAIAAFLSPLKLPHTTLAPSGLFDQNNPFARSYSFVGDSQFSGVTDTTDWDLSFDWTNGSGVSSAQDVLTFTQALFGGQVFPNDKNRLEKDRYLTQMITPNPPQEMAKGRAALLPYGYGLEVVSSDPWFGEKAYKCEGDIPGAYARWLYYPGSGRTIFIAFNRDDKRFNTDPPLAPAPDPPQVNASQKADALLNSTSTLIRASQ